MRILIDVRLLVKGRRTGIERYAVSLVNELLARYPGERYDLFYNGFRRAPLPTGWREHPSVTVHDWRVPNRPLGLWLRAFGHPTTARVAAADLVWSPHFNLLPVPRRTPHVITFHDLSFRHYPEFYPARKRFWHFEQAYAREARRAAAIAAVSDFTRQDVIRELGVLPARVHVVYPGVDAAFWSAPWTETARAAFTAKHRLERPFLLSVGTLEPRKNLPELIAAFEALKARPVYRDFELVVAGERGWLYDKILRRAASSPVASSIRFVGPVSDEELRELYRLARAFAFPSFFEGFGFPVLEAQAAGVPVVASSRSSIPEIAGDSALLADPFRTEELVAGLSALLDDGTLRERLVARGRAAAGQFTWRRSAESLMNLFRSLV